MLKYLLCGLPALLLGAAAARADDAAPEDWALHGQATFLEQFHPAFRSPYGGDSSMFAGAQGRETFDATAYAGVRPWDGAEAWADFEMDQGFGLSGTQGIAAFPSGEAYKIGSSTPYFRLQRLFLRQVIDLGGDSQDVEGAANQLAGKRTADNVTITLGKFAVGDVFDTNAYAHDPRADFMSWALIDGGGFDYAADAWGYSYGGAVEWSQDAWTLRGGFFALSRVPNGTELDTSFRQFELDSELERRYSMGGEDGKIKLLLFMNQGDMGSYNDALTLAAATHATPSTKLVRQYRSRPGGVVNVEQGLTGDLGVFLRASMNDGSQEAYEFTDMNRSLAAGLSLKGARWDRKDDTIGLAFETSAISHAAQAYFAAGGQGVLIGDGRLPHYEDEKMLEAYYQAALFKGVAVTLDYQLVANPAYNADRGPVSVLGLRLHGEL